MRIGTLIMLSDEDYNKQGVKVTQEGFLRSIQGLKKKPKPLNVI